MADRKTLENLRREIVEAFSDVPYPGDEYLVEPHHCGECSAIGAIFKGKRWQDWMDKPLELVGVYKSVLTSFTPAAFQYYLPLTLSAISGWPEEADTLVGNLIFKMTPSEHGDLTRLAVDDISTLTDSQIRAVISTLQFLQQEHGNWFLPGQIEKAVSELQQWIGSDRKKMLGGTAGSA